MTRSRTGPECHDDSKRACPVNPPLPLLSANTGKRVGRTHQRARSRLHQTLLVDQKRLARTGTYDRHPRCAPELRNRFARSHATATARFTTQKKPCPCVLIGPGPEPKHSPKARSRIQPLIRRAGMEGHRAASRGTWNRSSSADPRGNRHAPLLSGQLKQTVAHAPR